MLRDQIDFFVAGAEVKRYHTVRTLQEETVGHHSHGVAMMCHILTEGQASRELLMAALTHDLAEHQLGDIPSPAKRKYGIGEQVNSFEQELLVSVGFDILLTLREQVTLKLADIAQGMLNCIREIELGNRTMRKIFLRYYDYYSEIPTSGYEKQVFQSIHNRYLEAV